MKPRIRLKIYPNGIRFTASDEKGVNVLKRIWEQSTNDLCQASPYWQPWILDLVTE